MNNIEIGSQFIRLFATANICCRVSLQVDDELEIDEGSITNVSVVSFDELCQQLEESLNAWQKSEGYLNISRQVRSHLNPDSQVRVILETNDDLLRRLPWHRCDFFRDYPQAEIALSQPEYQRLRTSQPKLPKNKVRILAVLGNSQGIDLEAEISFLQSLPDAEVVFLVQPSCQELNAHLWNSAGWDILFFAGHSQTEGETGRIYINENPTDNSLTIEQLEESLKAALEKNLKLAIFNSCDGLGLANALGKLHIPLAIVMREPVPNRVAQIFFQNFLSAFAIEKLPVYLAVNKARRQLQALEDEFPAASWLPMICQNPAVEPPTWVQLGGVSGCSDRDLFALQKWENIGKNEGGLLRGQPLTNAEYWLHKPIDEVSFKDKHFIELFVKLRDNEINKRRRKWAIAASLRGGLVLVLMLTGIALWQLKLGQVSQMEAGRHFIHYSQCS